MVVEDVQSGEKDKDMLGGIVCHRDSSCKPGCTTRERVCGELLDKGIPGIFGLGPWDEAIVERIPGAIVVAMLNHKELAGGDRDDRGNEAVAMGA